MSALFALLLAGSAPDPPVLMAGRAAGELHIDGRLDEPDWGRARPAAGFRQREPHEGEPATQPTEVRVLYDARNLYIGVLARDAEPKDVVAHLRQRDTLLTPTGLDESYEFAGDDGVAILLDPFHDRRNAVVFATNPNGAEFDALITDESVCPRPAQQPGPQARHQPAPGLHPSPGQRPVRRLQRRPG